MVGLTLVCLGLLGASPSETARGAEKALADYAEARARFGPGAEDQLNLALWCEAHGLEAERAKHLARAVLVDPSNAKARGLLGLVDDGHGRWRRPEAVAAGDAEAAALAEYNARRARTPDTAQGHWALALWCETHGLRPEAVAHLTTVTRLDPSKSAAWKHLGFRLYHGRWAAPEQVAAEKAEAEAQLQADRVWRPKLERLKGFLAFKNKDRRARAEAELAEVSDPRAVPAVLAVFSPRDPALARWAVQVLGQIDAPASSRALADLVAAGPNDAVRRAAAETLRRRDPREFLGRLIDHLVDPVTYHVRPVGGPGQTGELLVEGANFNLDRVYSPPPLPVVSLSPGTRFYLDGFGSLMVDVANAVPGTAVFNMLTPRLTWAMITGSLDPVFQTEPTPPNRWTTGIPGPRGRARVIEALLGPNWGLAALPFVLQRGRNWVASPDGLQTQAPIAPGSPLWSVNLTGQTAMPQPPITVPIGRIVAEIQRAANESRAQQREDVRVLERRNAQARKHNDPIVLALEAALGWSPGLSRSDWERWWNDQRGYTPAPAPAAAKQTMTENVDPDYSSPPVDRFRFDPRIGYYLPPSDCFAAGTPVRTLDGPRPIESVKVGDRVLAQDPKTGTLSYQPVVAVCQNPSAATLRVALGGETLRVTPIQRFWKAHAGWVMARDLKPGDAVRTLGGVARVAAVESGESCRVFNLEVAGGHDFFVGSPGTLAHDHTLPEPVAAPFDAPPVVALAGRAE